MDYAADILLILGAFGAALYCVVLSRRLRRFNDLEQGVGGAIAALSLQVDDMTKTLDLARGAADGSNESLEALTGRAESVAKRLELLVASMHDIPDAPDATHFNPGKNGNEAVPEDFSGFRTARAGQGGLGR